MTPETIGPSSRTHDGGNMKFDYSAFTGFQSLYLEESVVRGIEFRRQVLVFHADLVLKESHPDYVAPPPSLQYCQKPLCIVFTAVTNLVFKSFRFLEEFDEWRLDWGNID